MPEPISDERPDTPEPSARPAVPVEVQGLVERFADALSAARDEMRAVGFDAEALNWLRSEGGYRCLCAWNGADPTKAPRAWRFAPNRQAHAAWERVAALTAMREERDAAVAEVRECLTALNQAARRSSEQRATIAAQAGRIAELEAAVKDAAIAFMHYTAMHRQKGTAEGHEKAARNQALADRMRVALASPPPVSP